MKVQFGVLPLCLLLFTYGVAASAALQEESRSPLQRRVTLAVRGMPLEEVLCLLDPDRSLHLRAVRHLREKRLTLFARDETLQQIMDGLAELWSLPRYPARWIRHKDASGYELWQDQAAVREGERRELADRNLMERYLDKLSNLSDSNPDALQKTIQLDPQAGHWNRAWCLTAGAMLRELAPSSRAALLRGEEVYASPRTFSPRTQQLLFANVASLQRDGSLRAGGDSENPADIVWETDQERAERFQREGVALVLFRNDRDGRWCPQIRIRDPAKPNRVPTSGVVGPPLGFSGDIGESGGADTGITTGKQVGRQSNDARNRKAEETPLSQPQREALAKALSDGPKTMVEAEQLLHSITGRPIVADYYVRHGGTFEWRQQRAFAEAVRKSDTVEALLRAYGLPVNYRGTTRGQALVLRNRMWWADDAREVPLSLARSLRAALDERGYLNLDELAAAAALTREQLDTLGADYVLASTAEGIDLQGPWLRMYGSLDPVLRDRLRSPAGLSLADLPVASYAFLFPQKGRPPAPLRSRRSEDAADTRLRIYQERASHREVSLPAADGRPVPPPRNVAVMRTWFRLTTPAGPDGSGLDQPLAKAAPAPKDASGDGRDK